jgi:glucoamylase
VQPASGVFQARYLPDGSGVPDDRGDQVDGSGWALWAVGQVAAVRNPADRPALVGRYRTLLDRSTAAALAQIDNRSSLPPASADYWEVREWRRTLATAALLHAGLQSVGPLYASVGDLDAQRVAQEGAVRLGAAITDRFGRDGYPRHLGGRPDSVDLGVTFLLPPFNDRVDPGVVQAWQHAGQVMARPAGGLAPGGSWRDDGVSWTTATSSYALAAAGIGDRAEAVRRLQWLDQHRTPAGSLPEKVTDNSEPAAVAPLAWAAAVVILTADELEDPAR